MHASRFQRLILALFMGLLVFGAAVRSANACHLAVAGLAGGQAQQSAQTCHEAPPGDASAGACAKHCQDETQPPRLLATLDLPALAAPAELAPVAAPLPLAAADAAPAPPPPPGPPLRLILQRFNT